MVAGPNPLPALTARDGDLGVNIRRGPRGKLAGYPSPVGEVLEANWRPGNACAPEVDGLAPK